MYKRPCPGKNNQDVTNLSSHDGWVLQGFTDGNIAIKSHEYKDKNLHAPK
jgi:hypothetical protein